MSEFYGTWRTDPMECSKCGWAGKGNELVEGEMFRELFELDCPRCRTRMLAIPFPTIEESRANWDMVNESDKQMVEARERFLAHAMESMLTLPEQLPDIHSGEIVIVWDEDWAYTRSSGGPDRTTVLRWNDRILWSEPTFYDGIYRLEEVADLLMRKYGNNLKDLIPTKKSEAWLWGDLNSVDVRIDRIRSRIRNNWVADTLADEPMAFADDFEEYDEDELPDLTADFPSDYFEFRSGEFWVIDELRRLTKRLIFRCADEPDHLRKLAALSLAVSRLPFNTPKLNLEIQIGELDCESLTLSHDTLAISSGGSRDSDCGSDSFAETHFEMETTGFRNGSTDPFLLGGWFSAAYSSLSEGAPVEIVDYADAAIDWQPMDGEPWEIYERAMSQDEEGPFFQID
jgi:hypothetical protein